MFIIKKDSGNVFIKMCMCIYIRIKTYVCVYMTIYALICVLTNSIPEDSKGER